jgi:hypothetical protein
MATPIPAPRTAERDDSGGQRLKLKFQRMFGLGSVGTDPLNTDGSTFTAAEIQKRAKKAAMELGIQDDRKAQFFVGFDDSGRPTRQGLSASAPEFG